MSVCMSVLANCRSQFWLDSLGRCLKLFLSTDNTSCHESWFASQFGLEYAKNTKNYREYRIAHATVYLNEAATGHSTAAKGVERTDPSNSDNQNGDGGGLVCACSRVCARVCMRACMRARLQYTIIIFYPR